jgi:hypothetical protein
MMFYSSKRYLALLLVPCVLTLASCSTTDVRSEGAPHADLSKYHSFTWEPSAQLEQPDQFSARKDDVLDSQIKSEVKKDLATKGLNEISKEGDLRVSYAIRTYDNVQVEPAFLPYPYTPVGPNETIQRVVENQQGSLVLDFVDAKSGKLVWRGVAVSDIGKAGPDQDQIRDSIDKILKKLPERTENS